MSATNVKSAPGDKGRQDAGKLQAAFGHLAPRIAGKPGLARHAPAVKKQAGPHEPDLVVRCVIHDKASRGPVAGASYEVARPEGEKVAEGKTGADGRLEHPVDQAGVYLLRVTGIEGKEPPPEGIFGEERVQPIDASKSGAATDVYVFAGTHVVEVELDIDPEDPDAHDDKLTLKSADGAFEETKTVKDDVVPGDRKVTLVFEVKDPDATYSLLVDPGEGGEPHLLADDLTATSKP